MIVIETTTFLLIDKYNYICYTVLEEMMK